MQMRKVKNRVQIHRTTCPQTQHQPQCLFRLSPSLPLPPAVAAAVPRTRNHSAAFPFPASAVVTTARTWQSIRSHNHHRSRQCHSHSRTRIRRPFRCRHHRVQVRMVMTEFVRQWKRLVLRRHPLLPIICTRISHFRISIPCTACSRTKGRVRHPHRLLHRLQDQLCRQPLSHRRVRLTMAVVVAVAAGRRRLRGICTHTITLMWESRILFHRITPFPSPSCPIRHRVPLSDASIPIFCQSWCKSDTLLIF